MPPGLGLEVGEGVSIGSGKIGVGASIGNNSGDVTRKHAVALGHVAGGGLVSGDFGKLAEEASLSFLIASRKEKETLQLLNYRLEEYIKRAGQLNSDNIAHQKNRMMVVSMFSAHVASVKSKHIGFIEVVKGDLWAACSDHAGIVLKLDSLKVELKLYFFRLDEISIWIKQDQHTYDEYSHHLRDIRLQITHFHERYHQLHGEHKQFCSDNAAAWLNIFGLRAQLDGVRCECSLLDVKLRCFHGELAFMRSIQQKTSMTVGMLVKHIKETPANFDYKIELAGAISDIKIGYVSLTEQAKLDIRAWYQTELVRVENLEKIKRSSYSNKTGSVEMISVSMEDFKLKCESVNLQIHSHRVRLSEFSERRARLRHEWQVKIQAAKERIKSVQAQCQMLAMLLHKVLDTKEIHETEIRIYHAMIDSLEKRVNITGYSSTVMSNGVSIDYKSGHSSSFAVGGTGSKSITNGGTYRCEGPPSVHNGNIEIKACDYNGKFIVLKNTSTTTIEDIGGYGVHRRVDSKAPISFYLPQQVMLKPGQLIKLYAGVKDPNSSIDCLSCDTVSNWGIGDYVITTLTNNHGQVVASHTQGQPPKNDYKITY